MDVLHEPRAATPDRGAFPRGTEGSAERQAALLARADPELRREVESLLGRQSESLFLDRAAVEASGQSPDDQRARRSRLGHSSGHIASKASSARAAWARCTARATRG